MFKIVFAVFFSTVMYILPLAIFNLGNFNELDIKIVFLLIFSTLVIFTQPDISIIEIQKTILTDKLSVIYILLIGFISQFGAVSEYAITQKGSLIITYYEVIGLVLVILGYSIRIQAQAILDRYFTACVVEIEDWELIEKGIYGFLRHPSYTGAYAMMVGATVFLQTWYSMVFTTLIMFLVYSTRIKHEEKALEKYFGEKYNLYRLRTYRFIPFLY